MTQDPRHELSQFVPELPDDLVIWRYMDFTKFVALLETKHLFFPRVSILEDSFEGSFPTTQPALKRVLDMLPQGAIRPSSRITVSAGLDGVWKFLRQWALVSCWHASPYESAAMWRLYAATNAAVAIRSTVAKLRTSLDDPSPMPESLFGFNHYHVGAVEYIDFASDLIPTGNLATQFFRKRRSFEHEREVRILLLRYPVTSDQHLDYERAPGNSGEDVPVDLAVLLDEVFIAPQAPSWYATLVKKVATRYGLAVTPQQSELDANPVY